ncbi:hypothetical protein RHGRI_003707 [Rhododendron griersonianum]|uniref:Uncharacterized protein n=1 Tax=Rhododendron griersonianum TaxID=479676 RepID=A0AAV6L7W2_9ERIC|nr:hypothetical protein RHGRI_003707 [Rhododendron griersonianum]
MSSDFSGNLPTEYICNWNGMKMINKEKLTYMHAIPNIDQYQTLAGPTTHEAQFWWWGKTYEYSMKVVSKGTKRLYERIQSALVVVDLSSNTFVGDIPESLGTLSGLLFLNISNNKLTSAIPSSLAKLTELESLDLSQNLSLDRSLGIVWCPTMTSPPPPPIFQDHDFESSKRYLLGGHSLGIWNWASSWVCYWDNSDQKLLAMKLWVLSSLLTFVLVLPSWLQVLSIKGQGVEEMQVLAVE